LPEPLREFLLETCILERFNARLADAVRDRSDSEDLLEQLRHFDALLIPLDNAREWFRYHPLFADYLYQRLKRSLAQRPVILRRRAARALAEVGDLPEAVQHAVAADDIDLAVTLTQQAGGWELILWKGIEVARVVGEILAVGAVAHGIGEPGIEALENAGFEQKFAQRLRQVGDDLLGQVVRHLSRTTGEVLQGIRVVASTIEPQAGQLQRDGPTFRAGMQQGQIGRRYTRTYYLGRLLQGERQVTGIELRNQ